MTFLYFVEYFIEIGLNYTTYAYINKWNFLFNFLLVFYTYYSFKAILLDSC